MSLPPGTRFGAYEIVAPIGAGGMGEVYRAHDTRLDRDVAIKVLPESFATDRDRLERFSREARSASALNHPNILTIHELGTHEGKPYIVSELLEGSDLRGLLKGKPLPAKKAVDYAQQMLDGLGAAHDKGIVHRDLKPANVFVTREGRVKILDFGLAKPQETSHDDATRPELTGSGIVMGTAGYMSPEQVRGGRADQRSDLFSFGAVLYEMLSGLPAFSRSTGVETMTAVLNDEPPDFQERGIAVQPGLDKIVRRCLEKAPEKRFHSASDLAFAIGTLQSLSDSSPRKTPAPSQTAKWRTPAIAAAAVVLVAAIAFPARSWLSGEPPPDRHLLQLSFAMPRNTAPMHVAISPDGRWVAFTGVTDAKTQLWVRALDEPEARLMPGTDAALMPFWSPDSRSIGYFAAGKLRRVDPTTGVSTTLGEAGVPTGGTWSKDGVILYGTLGGAGLKTVSSSGGEQKQVLAPDATQLETDFANPMFLPDGRHYFYSIFSGKREGRGTFVSSIDGGSRHRVVEDASNAAIAEIPGRGTFMFYVRDTALMVQRFDTTSLSVTGDAVALADVVGGSFDGTGALGGRRTFSVSNTGLAIFDPVSTRLDSHLFWIDRDGKNEKILEEFNRTSVVRVSPDLSRIAVARPEGERANMDIYVAAATGEHPVRFTFDSANDIFPLWSPDSTSIVWSSNRDGSYRIYRKSASGSGGDEPISSGKWFALPTDWSADGKNILYRRVEPSRAYDIWVLPVAGGEPYALLASEANEAAAVMSPNGKWIAYASDETGRYEVYVDTFPPGRGKRQVSTLGGNGPQWRGDGGELYYHAPDGGLMATAITPGTGAIVAPPAKLFSFPAGGHLVAPYYSATKDGKRFLLSKLVQHSGETPLTVLVDWPSRLATR
jgi:serine/threonine protein kinase/Tol biopolymer transport system component